MRVFKKKVAPKVIDSTTCEYRFAVCSCPTFRGDREEGIAFLQEAGALTYRCRGAQGLLELIPMANGPTVSFAVGGDHYFLPQQDYVFELADFDGQVVQTCNFWGMCFSSCFTLTSRIKGFQCFFGYC